MKTVAIVLNTSWNIFNFRLNLMRAFKEQGFQVIAIAPRDEYSERLLELGFDEYHEIKMSNAGMNPMEDLRTLWDFIRLYRKVKPDIICHYTIKPNIYGTLAASINNIPSINNVAGLGTLFLVDNMMTKLAKLLYKIALSRSHVVLFQNQDDCDLFIEGGLVKKEKVDLIPGSGVDLVRFSPRDKPYENDTLKFLLIGRMLWDKGVGEFVSAARLLKAKYPQVVFQLLGAVDADNRSAITKSEVQQWVEEGIVEYLGNTDNVGDYISMAGCVVLPSYREGVPRTLLESAAMAKPLVTTDTVGCKDVVDDGVNGFLCELKSSEDLALKIEKIILMSNQNRITMGENGRRKIETEFDENIVLSKYLEIVGSIQ